MKAFRPRTTAIVILIAAITAIMWYFDVFHKPVERVNKVIVKDYAYAIEYFDSPPDDSTSFNINSSLNEFQGGVLTRNRNLKDSLIHQYTWIYRMHKVTIWTGETAKSKKEIIDAIRYKNTVQF